MEIFVFVICLMLMLVAHQFGIYWFILIVAGAIIYLSKDTKTFILISVVVLIIYLINDTPYDGYTIYVISGAILVYMIINKEGSSQDTFNPSDQYADLLKGLGG